MRNEMPSNFNGGLFSASGLPSSEEAENLSGDSGNSRYNTSHADTHADPMPYTYRMTSNRIEPVNNSSPTPSIPTNLSREKVGADKKFDLTQYHSVTDIDVRLHELEKQEYNRHETRQAAIKRRQVKDAELKRKRDLEDEKWQEEEELHEKEEGELRRARKRLKRESMGLGASNAASHPVMSFLKVCDRSFQRGHSPTLNSYISNSQVIKPRVAPTRRKYNKTEKWDKRHGPPEGCDKYGRFVWLRKVDGRMVTIKCNVVGCAKNEVSFKTIHGLMCHLKRDHKIELEGREHLLMRCGDVADMGDDGTTTGAENQDNSDEEGYLHGGSAHERTGGLFGDAAPLQTDVNSATDRESRPSILSHVQINPNVLFTSIESSKNPRVQPQLHANKTDFVDHIDQEMMDTKITLGAQIPEAKERSISIKEESVSVFEQSRLSSLFGSRLEEEDAGESREEDEARGGEGLMDVVEIVRRDTPDDEVIRKLLSGVPENAFAML